MGTMHAMTYAGMQSDAGLAAHLQSNHFPPVHLAFLPAAKAAIEAASEGAWGREITLPNGLTRSADFIVRGLHLDAWVDDGDEYYDEED